jgi:Phage integrase, N-terminal SAM-like domain
VSCDRLSRNGSAWGGKSGAVAASDTASSGFRARHPHLNPRSPPKFEHHDALYEPTLIAAVSFQTTASSRRGSFGQAELAGDRVITRWDVGGRRYHPEHASRPLGRTDSSGITRGGPLPWCGRGELIARVRAELPHLAGLGQREELLAAAWLISLRSARTRRAYAGDLRAWLAWLGEREVDVLAAGRVHADLWVADQLERGAEAASVRRRLLALSSFYRYCAAHDLVARIPTAGVTRPVVDPDYTATVGLTRDEARALVAAADADHGR